MGWSELLDDMEERVRAADRALTGGAPAPSEFTMPVDVGPLPAALADRARAVFAASLEVQRRLQDAVAVVASSRRVPVARPLVDALYVDQRA